MLTIWQLGCYETTINQLGYYKTRNPCFFKISKSKFRIGCNDTGRLFLTQNNRINQLGSVRKSILRFYFHSDYSVQSSGGND